MTVFAATDFSEPANRAIRVAGREARLREESLTVAHCLHLERRSGFWWHVFDRRQIDPEHLHDRARRRLEITVDEQLPRDKRPAEIDLRTVIDSPADSLRQLIEQIEPSVVVIGATGRGSLESAVVGSTAEELIRAVGPPVLTVPADGQARPFKQILAPVDLSEPSEASLSIAAELTDREAGRLLVMHEAILHATGRGRPGLDPSNHIAETYRTKFEQKLAGHLEQFELGGIEVETIVGVQSYETRSPARAIVRKAEQRDIDLIVMSTRGRRGFRRFVLGSTTLEVLHEMPTPLMTVCARHQQDG